MAHNYSISEFGLKLIKAYEGFRPVETTLVSGQRVIGYGHIFTPGDMAMLNKRQAEDLLQTDLAPFEALINTNVYAPLSQSQFDALVSLSFNIGEQAFLNSSVLYHLNTGQPLAAAAGFDEWRKGVIGGKHYIVDALVRRRTAEKALFLRPATGIVAAPRHELPPKRVEDDKVDDESMDVFENTAAVGFVGQVPYSVDDEGKMGTKDDAGREQLTSPLQLHEHTADESTSSKTDLIDDSPTTEATPISSVLPAIHAPAPKDNADDTPALIAEEDTVIEETVVEDTIADNAVAEDEYIITEETVFEEAVAEDVITENIISENEIVNDLVSENVDFETITGINLIKDADLPEEQTEIDGPVDEAPSPIAVAAAQVSERLDRLIDEEPGSKDDATSANVSGIKAAAQQEFNEDIVQNEGVQEAINPDSTRIKLAEIHVPGNLDYNLQTPSQQEDEPEAADEAANQQVIAPSLTLVETNDAPKDDQHQQTTLNQKPDMATEAAEKMPDISDVPTKSSDPKQDIVIDEYGVVEEFPASTPPIQEAIENDPVFTEKAAAPVAALQNQAPNLVANETTKGKAGFWIAPLIGLALLGGGMWKTKFASNTNIATSANEWSAYIGPVALLVGGLLLFGGLYYLLKALMPRNLAS